MDDSWQDEETTLKPAIPEIKWTPEAIENWRSSRKIKYPTVAKSAKAKKVREAVEARRNLIRKVKQASQSKPLVKKTKKPFHKRPSLPKASASTSFQFPDFDYENETEGFRDGIYMFPGTKSFDISPEESLESFAGGLVSYDISDDDDDIEYRAVITDSETEMVCASQSVEAAEELVNPSYDNETAKCKVDDLVATDEDEDPPEVQSIKVVKETPVELLKCSRSSRRNKKKPTESKKDYSEVLKRPRRPPTLLEKLLQSEIQKERYELLQCLHFVCSNNFFGIGHSNK